jgi:hypothetical protein
VPGECMADPRRSAMPDQEESCHSKPM